MWPDSTHLATRNPLHTRCNPRLCSCPIVENNHPCLWCNSYTNNIYQQRHISLTYTKLTVVLPGFNPLSHLLSNVLPVNILSFLVFELLKLLTTFLIFVTRGDKQLWIQSWRTVPVGLFAIITTQPLSSSSSSSFSCSDSTNCYGRMFLHLLLTYKVRLLRLIVCHGPIKAAVRYDLVLPNVIRTNAPSVVTQITSLERQTVFTFFLSVQVTSNSLLAYYLTHALVQYSTKFLQNSEHLYLNIACFVLIPSRRK